MIFPFKKYARLEDTHEREKRKRKIHNVMSKYSTKTTATF